MMVSNFLKQREAQIRASLYSEGYRLITSAHLQNCRYSTLRHWSNGNRITIITAKDSITMKKNGQIIKIETDMLTR